MKTTEGTGCPMFFYERGRIWRCGWPPLDGVFCFRHPTPWLRRLLGLRLRYE